MSILNNIYGANNSPFDNFVRSNYVPQTPQNRLQMAYQQAMAKRTPEWARTISDMMPSIAEMVAYGTTKGAFNQGTIANSLEREKQRRTAYNQMMRENEDKQVNDYVQMAKEQLGIDMAQDDREYGRNLNELRRAEELERQKRAYQQYEEQQRIAEEQRKFDNDIKQREIALKESIANAKPTEMTPEQQLQNELEKEKAKETEKAKFQAEQDVKKAKADYSAFESNIENLKNLSKSSGTVIDRSIGTIAGLFSGKDNALTRPNDASQEVKAQLIDAIFKANGIDGDKVTKEQSKIILAKAGMPNSNNLTQAQVDTIIKNIQATYRQRIAGKQAFLDSFNENSVSWEQ